MEDITKLTQRLTRDLNALVNVLETNMDKINAQDVPAITQVRAEMEQVKKAVREGNIEPINSIIQKYASINR